MEISYARQDCIAKGCIECLNKGRGLHCDACKKSKVAAEFDQNVLDNATWHGRRRVCLACCANGCSPRDVELYPCAECGERGHLKFQSMALRNYKRPDRSSTLVCTDCITRHSNIQKLLRERKSLRCTCPGKQADRQHLPGYEKCALYPQFAGDQRWPGMNNKVSREDYLFSERMNKRRRT